MNMRQAFANGLANIADRDERVLLLTADLGYGALDEFQDRHPDKFINVGVAECAMIGAATGLAKEGFIPYCYSIAPFAVLRPLEFIRNGPAHHNLPVRIVGTGRRVEYGYAGRTHWEYAVKDALKSIDVYHITPLDNSWFIDRSGLSHYHTEEYPFYLSLSKN